MERLRQPRSSAVPVYVVALVLASLGLIGVVLMLLAMRDVGVVPYTFLVIAIALSVVSIVGLVAVVLTTNTRRPWGIDPNDPTQMARSAEVLAQRTAALNDVPVDEQLAPSRKVRVDWQKPGRRQTDLPLDLVQSFLDKFEAQATSEGSGIGMEVEVPDWAQRELDTPEARAALRGTPFVNSVPSSLEPFDPDSIK